MPAAKLKARKPRFTPFRRRSTCSRSSAATSRTSSSSSPATNGVQSSPWFSLSSAVNGLTINSPFTLSSNWALAGRRNWENARLRFCAPGASIRTVQRLFVPLSSQRPWLLGVTSTGHLSAKRRGFPFSGACSFRNRSTSRGGTCRVSPPG